MSQSPIWFWILGGFLTSVTVFGNVLVIYVITSRKRLHTTPNCFVLSLSCADFFFRSSYLPSLGFCELNFLHCINQDIRRATVYLLAFISVANLCTMTLDRYIAIVRPLQYLTIMRSKRVRLLIFGAWFLPVLLYLVPRTAWLLSTGSDGSRFETIAFYLVHPLLLEILPWFVLIWFTGRILFIAQKHSRREAALAAQLNHNRHDLQVSRKKCRRSLEISSAKVILVVVAVFIICYTSDIAFSVCTLFEGCTSLMTPFQLLFRLLWISNSGANPLAYAFLKKDIKRELKKLCTCNSYQRNSYLGRLKWTGTRALPRVALARVHNVEQSD